MRAVVTVLLFVGLMSYGVFPSLAADQHSPAAGEADLHPNSADHKEDQGHKEQPGLLDVDLGAAVWTIVLFVGLLAVLSKFVWPHILKGLQDREEKLRRDLQNTEKAAQQAQETLKQYQAQLAEARTEARQIIEQSRVDAQKIGQQIKDEAQREMIQIRQRAQTEIRTAKEQAITEIYAEAATLSTQIAGRILQREISPNDHAQLVQETLGQLTEAVKN